MNVENGRSDIGGSMRMRPLVLRLAAAGLAAVAVHAGAVPVQTGIEDFTLNFDNSLRYNVGTRLNGIDPRIGNNPAADEGDYRFGKHDVVTNRLDLLSELEGEWKQTVGFRVSASAWYDHAYRDNRVRQNPALANLPSSYIDNEYSGTTKRFYHGPSGEILDAFVYVNSDIGGKLYSLKLGKLVSFWGNSLFTSGGIAYSQQPVDGRKGAATPGTETRELFLPLNQLSGSIQLTPSTTVGAQYYLDWAHVRSPEGGTYLGGTDLVLDGPQRAGGGLPFTRGEALGPEHQSGNWGVYVKTTLASLNSSTVGLYLRGFDEKTGLWVLRNPLNPLEYRAVFPRGTRLIGASIDTSSGPFAIGGELSFRQNAGLNTVGFASGNEGARGNTWHASANTLYGLTQNALWDAGTISAELTYDRLVTVTRNEALFNKAGSALCPLGIDAGCATRQAWGVSVRAAPAWSQVFPGVDLSTPLFVQAGLKGNTADFGGTNEGYVSYSVGAEFDIRKRWIINLTYADARAPIIGAGTSGQLGPLYTGNGSWQTTDRGRLSLTAKVAY